MSDLPEPAFNHDVDVLAVADYLIKLDALRPEPDVTPLKLAKLLYLAQANYLASTGQRMFDENVEAYENGPVVHRAWKQHGGRQIIATAAADSSQPSSGLPEDVADFLDAVWARYGDRSATDLWRLTHNQAPWIDNFDPNVFRPVIPDEDMATYFRDHVAPLDRVLHPGVVIIPEDFLDDDDAKLFAEHVASYTGP